MADFFAVYGTHHNVCDSCQILGCPVVIPTDGPNSNRQTEKVLNRIINELDWGVSVNLGHTDNQLLGRPARLELEHRKTRSRSDYRSGSPEPITGSLR
jgi:hypothetical protein